MRRFQPHPKDRRKVQIPADLRESLREVYDLIREAKNDADIALDCDDAIQVGGVCGGRCRHKPRPYVLTYFPKDDAENGRWFLTLAVSEIEDIADGRMTEIVMHCCTPADCRSKFREANAHCFKCDYFDDANFGTFEFPTAGEKLLQRNVAGISERSTWNDVLAILGPPQKEGGGVQSSLGYIWPWIVYHREDCQIRFEFGKNGLVKNITVMEKDWEPGK